ncbi:unnamed protein product [Caenorhabditis angaria]|uniref:Uncharacterized protein n=1 Tax=Caenorhabditis angaria TaxID=860376 RepID=A0A9P1IQL6_9PELO|nr:unnamed protein product [Caenorhabditis angaria]
MLLVLFLLVPPTFPVKVAKLELSYKFLAGKTRPTNSTFFMDQYFGPTVQGVYNSSCKSNRCYFPVFKIYSGILAYTILSDIQSDYCSGYSKCIGFSEEQYQNYTIVFGDPKILGGDNFADLRGL